HDLPGDQKIEQHTDGGQVLFDSGRGGRMLLDVGGNENGIELFEFDNVALLAPAEKLGHSVSVGSARILVADVLAVKNSIKRQAAPSPARAIGGGSCSKPARARSRRGGVGTKAESIALGGPETRTCLQAGDVGFEPADVLTRGRQ